jgi:sensor histidine kinase YesM
MRRLPVRFMAALTWQKVGAVTLFCAVYGFVLSLDPDSGGAPASLAAYLAGCAGALKLFFPALLLVAIAASFAPASLAPRAVTLGVAVAIGLVIGHCAMAGLPEVLASWRGNRLELLTAPLGSLSIGWLGVAVYLLQERDNAAKQALHDEMERQLELERQTAEAQLQVLQSQVEPHFLFNTLAHLRRLYATNPTAARVMMRDLVRYLGAAQSALCHEGITLREDVELAVAYLNLQKVRMGPRLTFDVDIPAAASGVRVPPMMITTLVENAIKHGLSALPEGGTIRIGATTRDNLLSIEVCDTGQGLQASLGTGVGLANVRARLTILHGSAAELALSRNTPSGVRATVVLPRWPMESAQP